MLIGVNPSYGGLRFWLISLALLICGAIMRLSSGWIPLSDIEAEVSAAEINTEEASQLIDSVLRFYRLIDDGKYTEAYQLCLENKWQVSNDTGASIVGLVTQEEFVQTLTQEIGPQGLGQDIIQITVTDVRPFATAGQDLSKHPELQTLRYLSPLQQVKNIYLVTVQGALLGRCSQWNWEKQLVVAHLKSTSGENWRLLLPGKSDARFPHYVAWFTDRVPW